MNRASTTVLMRALVVITALALMLGTELTTSSAGDLQSQIDSSRAAAGSLRSTIAADSTRISQTSGSLQDAERRLAAIQGQLSTREDQLRDTQRRLLAARARLVVLENRMQTASRLLAANLVAGYEGSRPDLISVILSARGFKDLLEQVSFLERVGHQDATILSGTRTARAAVATQTAALAGLEQRRRTLTDQVLVARNQVSAVHAALLRRQIAELGTRAHDSARLQILVGQLGALQSRAAEEARQAAATAAAAAAVTTAPAAGATTEATPPVGSAPSSPVALDSGGQVQPPPGAPAAVAQVIAAGNAIATLPYVWGGGHGSFHDSGYDCSGSVSYALAAAGLLSSPLDSTGFESWGDPGPGRWITVYANAGHAFMVVAGWRFDTVALSEGGTRWSQSMADTSGFVARHPPGL